MPSHRAALCLTGQLRSLPIAYENWARGTLLTTLSGFDVDWFVVTSQTNSLGVWQDWLARVLKPTSVLSVEAAVRTTSDASASWAHRLVNGTSLEFNFARLPRWLGEGKGKATLLQLWQCLQCRDRIQQHEARLGISYSVVARVRSDIVIDAVLWPSYLSDIRSRRSSGCCLGKPTDGSSPRWCLHALCATRHGADSPNASHVHAVRRAAARACAARIRAGTPWLVHSDFFAVGSRDVMLVRALSLLDALADNASLLDHPRGGPFHAAANAFSLFMRPAAEAAGRTADEAWEGMLASDRRSAWANGFYLVRSAQPACRRALGDVDLVRVFGPPASAYFLQESEALCDPSRCVQGASQTCPHGIVTPACVEMLHERWSLPKAIGSGGACAGLRYKDKRETLQGTRPIGDFAVNARALLRGGQWDGWRNGAAVPLADCDLRALPSPGAAGPRPLQESLEKHPQQPLEEGMWRR